VGVRVGVVPCWNKRALRIRLRNLHAKSQLPSSYSFIQISAFIQTGGQTDMARSTRLVILIKNFLIYGVMFVTYCHIFWRNYFKGSETLPSTSYILSEESSIPFYSTSNVYNKECKSLGTIFWSWISYRGWVIFYTQIGIKNIFEKYFSEHLWAKETGILSGTKNRELKYIYSIPLRQINHFWI